MEEKWPGEQQLAVGLLLAVVGGFLDTYTYFTRGGVFANAQTGNMVLLSIAAAQGDFGRAGQYLIPILAFTLGVMATEGLRARAEKKGQAAGHWQRTVLLIEAAILAVVGLLPPEVPNFLVNVTVSFLCSMQVNGFRLLEGMPYATTMCTGNLRSGSHHLWQFLFAGAEGRPLPVGDFGLLRRSGIRGAPLPPDGRTGSLALRPGSAGGGVPPGTAGEEAGRKSWVSTERGRSLCPEDFPVSGM